MRNHPLTPKTDPSLVQVLQRQTRLSVGLVGMEDVMQGVSSIKSAFDRLRNNGIRIAIVDAISDAQLFEIGQACKNMILVTGGSGIACGLPKNFSRAGLAKNNTSTYRNFPEITGAEAIITGSCSVTTLKQLAYAKQLHPVYQIDPTFVMTGKDVVSNALSWAMEYLGSKRPIFAASAEPNAVATAQEQFGQIEVSEALENVMASIAQGIVEKGVRRLIVAGGETSGAVVQKLGISALRIGPEIDPGVPWCETLNQPSMALALKSGNFGEEDFFTKAFEMLP